MAGGGGAPTRREMCHPHAITLKLKSGLCPWQPETDFLCGCRLLAEFWCGNAFSWKMEPICVFGTVQITSNSTATRKMPPTLFVWSINRNFTSICNLYLLWYFFWRNPPPVLLQILQFVVVFLFPECAVNQKARVPKTIIVLKETCPMAWLTGAWLILLSFVAVHHSQPVWTKPI